MAQAFTCTAVEPQVSSSPYIHQPFDCATAVHRFDCNAQNRPNPITHRHHSTLSIPDLVTIPPATSATTSSLPPSPVSTPQPFIEKEDAAINPLEAIPSAFHPSPVSTPQPSVEREEPAISRLGFDYQLLPSPPEPAYWSYDPGFGARVQDGYQSSLFRDRLRANKYGAEIAKASRFGLTPSPVRRKWDEEQEELLRLDELGTPGAEDSEYTPEPVVTPREQDAMSVPKIAGDGFPLAQDEYCMATSGGAEIPKSYVVGELLHTDQCSVAATKNTLPFITNIQPTSRGSKKRGRSDISVELKDNKELSDQRQRKRARLF